MRKVRSCTAAALCGLLLLGVSPLATRAADQDKEYGKARLLLNDAKRASQVGGDSSALEKYGEALIILRRITVKDPTWKQAEVSASLSEAEAGYIRTLTGAVVKLQNASIQRSEIAKQQAEILTKINALMKKNSEIMEFLLENRDLIEKVDSSLRQ